MTTKEYIPTLIASEIDRLHTDNTIWKLFKSSQTHQECHINRIEDLCNKSSFQVLPHRKTVHDFIFLKKGISKRSKGLNKYEFGASSIFFLPAYQITQHEMMSDDAEGFYCHFDEEIFDYLPKNYLRKQYPFFQYQSHPVIELSESTLNYIELILNRILELYKEEKTSYKHLISCSLLVIFEEIKKEIPIHEIKTKKNSFLDITERYKNALEKHIYEHQNILYYAKIMNITPDYLNKCVKNSTDKTAQDLLKEMLILEAKTLLKYSNLNVSEIAIKLCDQNPSNFARFFKKQTGITPLEYQQLH
ncbi:helix-turn-helix domain-containing protein [Flavobacterium sp. ZT3R25]|uniref:helix-turn-helix domain-containing protein n=1 Tax=Flavobacterium galactosi TaxID=3398735 RepID=UPI003A89E2C7